MYKATVTRHLYPSLSDNLTKSITRLTPYKQAITVALTILPMLYFTSCDYIYFKITVDSIILYSFQVYSVVVRHL